MTHWRLADGTEVEICSWLDDHSRYLLGCTAFGRVDGDDVVTTFCAAGEEYGWPAATLTDNGAIYTSRFTRGHNAFEHLLAYLGIRQRNGAPEPSPDAGQDRALRADAQALARATARRAEPGRAAGPTRYLPPRLRRGATPPGDRPSHPRRSLRGDAQGPARGSSRPGSSPPALRHRRQGRRHDPASGRPPASPRDRGGPSRSSCPGHRRRAGGHRRGTRDRGGPLVPPHRARAPVLAQPTTKPRPMAGASSDRVTSVLVHRLSPMSRLMCHTCRDSRQWLARKDSNLQSPDPESGALPFGHSPARPTGYQITARPLPAGYPRSGCCDRAARQDRHGVVRESPGGSGSTLRRPDDPHRD